MQRAMHLASPDTTRWWLDEADSVPQPEETANRALWRTYLWRFHPDEHQPTWWRDVEEDEDGAKTEPAPRTSMVFVVQPPWILAQQDMKNFTQCSSVGTPTLPLLFLHIEFMHSYLRCPMTMFPLKVVLIAPTAYGQISSTLANAMNVHRLL